MRLVQSFEVAALGHIQWRRCFSPGFSLANRFPLLVSTDGRSKPLHGFFVALGGRAKQVGFIAQPVDRLGKRCSCLLVGTDLDQQRFAALAQYDDHHARRRPTQAVPILAKFANVDGL